MFMVFSDLREALIDNEQTIFCDHIETYAYKICSMITSS